MSEQTVWLTLISMGLVAYGLRLGSLLLAARAPVSGCLRLALRFVPFSALTAIIFLSVFVQNNTLSLSPLENERIVAAVVAAAIAYTSKNVLLTIGSGMAVFWGLRFILSVAVM